MVAVAAQRSFRVVPLLVVFVTAVLFFSASLRHLALSIVRFPFAVLSTSVRIVLTLPRVPALSHENAQLRAALAQQQLEAAQLRDVLQQTQQGEALLQALPSVQGLVAPVIARSLLPTQQTVLLGKGRRHGLTLDSIVLDVEGVIGRVIEVQPEASVVLLLTDADSRVAGLVERSRETGLVIGRGHGTLELAYVDADADIMVGDRIVTAGLGGPYPKGLLLGTVIRVTTDVTSGMATVLVRPSARLGILEEVLCIPSASQGHQAP